MTCLLKNCTGAILAGGENSRMPVLKAFIEVNNIKIIEKNLKIMKSLFNEVFIITNQPEYYIYPDTTLLGDIYQVRGPMTGLLTSLLNSSSRWVFASACDMPFINSDLIRFMAEKRNDCDAVVPRPHGKDEPLFALYSVRLIPAMEKAVSSGKVGLKDFLGTKRVKYIGAKEIRNIDPQMSSFVNINTPEDLKRILSR